MPARITLVLLLLSSSLHAQTFDRAKLPFGIAADAARLRSTMGLRALRALVEGRLTDPAFQTAPDHFLNAELLKQLGDPRAVDAYERAIATDATEPAYELFYADYLRNFRGPRRPLFAQAEERYFEALRKLRELEPTGDPDDVAESLQLVLDRIDRGLVALYGEDGVPLAWRDSGRPVLFLGTIHELARSPSDLGEVHDTRDFTSEALLAASKGRLNRPLRIDELQAIVRVKEPSSTANRLRFRSGAWPVIDVFYRTKTIGAAQITDFRHPRAFNDVDLETFGAGVENTFALRRADLHLRAAFSSMRRTGVVETAPLTDERIGQLDLGGVASAFLGPDKLNVDLAYSAQRIDADVDDSSIRHRRIAGVTAEYQILRPLPFLRDPYGQRFSIRGIHLRAGVASDVEDFGAVDVERRDVFVGLSVKGLGRFDVTLQPGSIDSRVTGDASQTNRHLRTDVVVLARIRDEEREPGIPRERVLGFHPAFVHLVATYKRDAPREGLAALQNDRFGLEWHAKFFHRSLASPNAARAHPATILLSARYERQRFPRIDRDLDLWGLSISLGR